MKKNSPIKIYGKHSVLEALKNKKRHHKEIILIENFQDTNFINAIKLLNVPISYKSKKEIDRLTQSTNHQNTILITSSIITNDQTQLKKIINAEKITLIALDQVTDPQNIGAVIRSALAFGIGAIILPEHSSPPETPAMIKASSGAIEHVPIFKVTNLSNTIKDLKTHNFWAIGLDGNAKESIHKTNFPNKTLLVMGSEGKGLRKLTQNNCDSMVKLETTGKIESLNVSNAAAIAMHEVFKQRLG